MTISIASVAPEVKIRAPSQPERRRDPRRAPSIACRTARPSSWAEEGLAHAAQAAPIAAAAAGRIGVVAA